MKNFISSIYVKPNSISDEKICVGLFIGGETTSYFAWSENKLKLTTKLASESVYSSLHRSFININNDITHKIGHESKGAIVKKHVYSSEYFQYLTNYNKGLIEFTSPKTISKSVDQKEFEKLFKLYVGENIIKLNKEIKETFKKKSALF
ncbi:MAG: hypothetical protein IPJ32_08200 [Sphingobacteriaceae bacterium]|nr:hypothetical protein [Sphingobacteriaceae bacterium]